MPNSDKLESLRHDFPVRQRHSDEPIREIPEHARKYLCQKCLAYVTGCHSLWQHNKFCKGGT